MLVCCTSLYRTEAHPHCTAGYCSEKRPEEHVENYEVQGVQPGYMDIRAQHVQAVKQGGRYAAYGAKHYSFAYDMLKHGCLNFCKMLLDKKNFSTDVYRVF